MMFYQRRIQFVIPVIDVNALQIFNLRSMFSFSDLQFET